MSYEITIHVDGNTFFETAKTKKMALNMIDGIFKGGCGDGKSFYPPHAIIKATLKEVPEKPDDSDDLLH